MPKVIPPGYVDAWLRISLTGDSELMFTSLGWSITTPPFTALDAIDLLGHMSGTFRDYMTSEYAILGGYVLVGQDGDPVRYDVTFGSADTGLHAGSAVPQNTAFLVRKHTASGGRRNRGRMFIPGVPESAVSAAGVVATATQSAYNGDLATMVSTPPAAANVTAPVIFHSTGSTVPTIVTSMTVAPSVATQRERLRR